MVTPFDDDGALDLAAAVALARWLASHGSDGLVVSGTTGEGPVLTDDEKAALWRAVAEAVTIPVIAGTGSNDTDHTIEMTTLAAQSGVDGVLVVTPYYTRPSQAGISAHFRVVAEAADRPARHALRHPGPDRATHRDRHHVAPRPRGAERSSALKDATGDAADSARLAAQAPAGFELYSGDDV